MKNAIDAIEPYVTNSRMRGDSHLGYFVYRVVQKSWDSASFKLSEN